jgi:hypothetical protein
MSKEKKMKKLLIILLTTLTFFTGCFFGNEGNFNLTKLNAKIDEAESELEGVTTVESASQIATGRKWVTSDEMDDFKAAISAAKSIRTLAESQLEVDDAVITLNSAIIEFKSQIKTNGTKTSGFTLKELTNLVTEAQNAKAGVQTSINGTDVSKEKYWVIADIMNALDNSINSANLSGNIDTKYNNLNSALNNFYDSKRPGTAISRSITITDLTQYYFLNGTQIEVGLFTNNNSIFTGNLQIHGNGVIRNDKVTVDLYVSSGNNSVLWTGSGLYYVGFRDNDGKYISKEKINFSNTTPNLTISFYNFEKIGGGSEGPGTGGNGTGGGETDQRAITITGLSSFINNSIEVSLFLTSSISEDSEPLYYGENYIYDGSITVDLYEGDYYSDPWMTGSGQYYVILCIGDYSDYSYYRSNSPVSFSNSNYNPTINFSSFTSINAGNFNPPNPITLTANTWANGNITTSGGEQWFKFTATAAVQYIHVTFNTLIELYVQSYNSNGNTVGNKINFYYLNETKYAPLTLTKGQTYFIKVWPVDPSDSGSYKIAFNTSATAPSP